MPNKVVIRTLCLLLLATSIFAAGSVQQSLQQLGGPTGKSWVLVAHWTGDAINGSVPATAAQIGPAAILQGYFVTSVETVPRAPAPTAGYSLTIKDQAGVDVLSGSAASLSASAPQAFSASTSLPPINGVFTLTITGQNVASAKGDIYVYMQAPDTLIGSGSPGSAGAAGTPGTNGTAVLNGSGVPSSGLGVNGDFYIDTVANRLYGPKSGGVWGSGVSLIGPTGATGAAGAAGTNGLSVLNGSGAPSGGTGVNGDFYIDTSTSTLYGPKSAGSWGSGTSLIGPQGPPGSVITLGPLQFLQGKPDQTSPTQQAADLPYFLTSDYDFPAQTPNVTLTASILASVTLTPCPLGVAGSDAYHNYRISGGTGTAETVVGTGGSCTSGASSGTIMFTPLNNHSGAWTFVSASSGAREAILASNGNAVIKLPPNATLSISGAKGLVIDKANLIIQGSGYGSVIQALAAQNLNELVNTMTANGLQLLDLTLDGNRSAAGTNPTFGTAIQCGVTGAGGCSHVLMRGLQVLHSAQTGILITDTNVDVEISRCWIHDNGGVTDGAGAGQGIQIYWATGSGNALSKGIRILDNYLEHNHNTVVNATVGGCISFKSGDVKVVGNYCLNNFNSGGQIVYSMGPLGGSDGLNGPAVIDDNTIITEATGLVTSVSGIESDAGRLTVSNNHIVGGVVGISLEGNPGGSGGFGAVDTVVVGNDMNGASAHSIGFINSVPGVRATTIAGNKFSNSPVGLVLDAGTSATVISANNFLSVTDPVQDNSSYGAFLSGNYPMAANLAYGGTIASADGISMRCGQSAKVSGATTIRFINLPSDTSGANGKGCMVGLIAAAGATWITGITGNISVASAPSPGQVVLLISDGTLFNPAAGGTTLPTTTGLQYLRGNEYTGALEAVAFPFVVAADYNFAPQSPGGSVAIGSNTKTLTPCPLGLGGSDTNHYIYVSGGSGAAEALLVAGGTCTSGAASGTVVFTAANTHTGAYTISSAGAGIPEAVNALPSTGGTVYLPASTLSVRELITVAKNGVILRGAGIGATVLQRTSTIATNHAIVSLTGNNSLVTGLTFDGNNVANAEAEIDIHGNGNSVDGIKVFQNTHIAVASFGTNVSVRNSYLIGLASTTIGSFGVWNDSTTADGLIVSGNDIEDQMLNGVFLTGHNMLVENNVFKGNHRQVTPTGGGQVTIKDDAVDYNIVISGNTIGAGGGSATSGIEADGRNERIIGNAIALNQYGIVLQTGSNVDIVGNTIMNNIGAGISVNGGISNWTVVGNKITDDQGSKTQVYPILIAAGASDHYIIANNDLRGNINPMSNAATGANRVIGGNLPASDNGVVFANLLGADNGTILYCTDCTIANPCAGAGNGAIAKKLNAVWVCN